MMEHKILGSIFILAALFGFISGLAELSIGKIKEILENIMIAIMVILLLMCLVGVIIMGVILIIN